MKPIGNKTKIIIVILLLIAFSAFFRLYSLTSQSVWGDEAMWVYFSQLSVSENILLTSQDFHMPLYNIILHYWITVFGLGEDALRSLSAIFGILGVVMAYLVGKKLFNSRVGLYSAVLLAVSSFHIYYSQQIRPYSLLALLGLVSFYFFIDCLNKDSKNKNLGNIWPYAWYFLAAGMLMYTHVFGLLIIVSQVCCLAFIRYKNYFRISFKRWAAVYAGLFLAFIPWINALISQINNAKNTNLLDWIQPPSVFGTNEFSLLGTAVQLSGDYLIFSVFFLLIGIYLIKSEKQNPNKQIKSDSAFAGKSILLFWIIVPVLISFIYSLVMSPIYDSKNIIYIFPAAYILVAASIDSLFSKKSKRIAVCIISTYAIILLLSQFSSLGFQKEYYVNEQWRETADVVKAYRNPGEQIIIMHPSQIYAFMYYYDIDCYNSPQRGSDIRNCSKEQKITALWDEKNIAEINLDELKSQSIWLVLSDFDLKNTPKLKESASSREVLLSQTFQDITVMQLSPESKK